MSRGGQAGWLIATAVLTSCSTAPPHPPASAPLAPAGPDHHSSMPARLAPKPSSPAETASAGPAYAVSVASIDAGLAGRMRHSWRAGCPVELAALRYLRVTYWGFDGRTHAGELVVHTDAVPAVTAAFRALYTRRFPIRQMRLVDDFAGSDSASMAADNTSALNCRVIAGTTTWSRHAYGRAVDINPVENPFVDNAGVQPPAGAPFARRAPVSAGMITAATATAFTAQGWGWGGTWTTPKDYQHFSADGH